jgi:hypothetical protein
VLLSQLRERPEKSRVSPRRQIHSRPLDGNNQETGAKANRLLRRPRFCKHIPAYSTKPLSDKLMLPVALL